MIDNPFVNMGYCGTRDGQYQISRIARRVGCQREVEVVLSFGLTTLREHILRLPNLVAAELRMIDSTIVRGIRHRIDERVHQWLEEMAETLPKAISAPDFFAALNEDDETDEQKAERERKRDLANAKRRQKYAARRKD